MKTTNYLLVALVALVGMQAKAQSRLVELPPAAYANTRTLEISKVALSDTATVLDMEAFFTPGYWIRVVSDSYLLADGRKYMIREGNGIDLDSLFWMPPSGEASFQLVFEPLPLTTEVFDFIESDCEDCFKIYGIDLVNSQMELPSIPEQFVGELTEEEGFKMEWQKGEATVSGVLWKFIPGTIEWNLMYRNPITAQENNVPIEIAEDGTFSASITVYSPTNLYLASTMANIPIKVAPGKKSTLFVNLPELQRANSRLRKDQPPHGKGVCYGGYLAKLNTDLTNDEISRAVQMNYSDSIADMNSIEYKEFIIRKYHEGKAHNASLEISPLAKNIINGEEVMILQNKISFADWEIIQANREKHGLSMEEAQQAFTPAEKPDDYNNFYQLIPYDDMDVLLVPSLSYMVRGLGYARKDTTDPYQVLLHLAEHPDVASEDRVFLTNYIAEQEKSEERVINDTLSVILDKHTELTDQYMKTNMGEGYLATIWGTDKSVLLDVIKAQKLCMEIEDYNPFTKEQKADLLAFPGVIQEMLLEQNQLLLAKIEENKMKSGYTVLETPQSADEGLFSEMLKPFDGKVILVDVWATWCGPCRMANTAMEPLKAQLADQEDLVYLYLAGEDSPKNTWKNMITDLKGMHYRVSETQWNYLRESLKARGVPTYIIIDREGNQAFHSTGFPGVDAMKRELMKALEL